MYERIYNVHIRIIKQSFTIHFLNSVFLSCDQNDIYIFILILEICIISRITVPLFYFLRVLLFIHYVLVSAIFNLFNTFKLSLTLQFE